MMKFLHQDDYLARCENDFFIYKKKIVKLLPNVRIEHIGASSIKGAISKGDVDIFIGVEKEDFEYTISVLLTLGFHEKENTLQTDELRMLVANSGADIAFQVVVNGSEFESFLKFRDKLRESEQLVCEYNDMKESCRGYSHIKYREKKSLFIENVLHG